MGTARAADPLNSNNRPANADAPGSSAAHNEFNIVPVGGGTTDIGIGGGYFAGFAHVRRGVDPYVWNIESSGFLTFAAGDGGGVAFPYQDLNLRLTVPRFAGSTAQLEIHGEYSWETTLNYFGLGNASSAAFPPGAPHKYFMYGRLHPELGIDVRWRIVDHLDGRLGLLYVENWLQVTDNSKLAEDLRSGDREVKALLGSTARHGVALLNYGIQWDTRDNNVSTHVGRYDSVNVMLSPGEAGTSVPYRYAEARAMTRFFIPIWKSHITLAGRLVGDLLYGNPPFYELSRFDGTYAIGGLNGVRGVPGQRYYGKIKALGNVEVRTEIVSFHALGKPLVFGVVGFLDAGRVWADISAHPELDGKAVGLKYGVGGGARLQSGSAFVIRADVAWSPDASPVGGYFAAGQMF